MNSTGPLIAGIDAGTTTIRTLLFSPAGVLVAEGRAPTPIEVLGGMHAEFAPDALWRATVGSIRQAIGQIDDPARVRGIAVASVGESGIALDASHHAVANSLAWYDQRPRAIAEGLCKQFDADALHMKSGMRLHPIASLSKMLWLRQENPEAFARTAHWLNVADYIAFRLSGEMATDFSLAGRMLCLDLDNGQWNGALLDGVGIAPSILPALKENGTLLGPVSKLAARETGLTPGCGVSVGGHDHIIGALAAGVFSTGEMLDSMGTAEALLLPLPGRTKDINFVKWGLEQGQIRVGGQSHFFVVGGLVTSGASIEWFRNLFGGNITYDELMSGAAGVALGAEGVLFLPYLRIGSPPDCHPAPSGAFLRLSSDADRGVLYRAVLEGLAFDTRNIRDHLMALLPDGQQRRALRRPVSVIGGGAHNALLLQIKAATFNSPLHVLQSKEAVSLGAAILAGLGCGLYGDLGEAAASVRISIDRHHPGPDLIAPYDEIFHSAFKPAADALHALRK